MLPFSKIFRSSVGKKYLMAITGLAMVIFLIEHLTGNLLLYSTNPDPYNQYAHFLISFGGILYVAEFILIGILLSHAFSGISVARGRKKARPVAYSKTGNAGGASRKTTSSMTMIFTGALLFIFIVGHIRTFKFGPVYTATVDGEQMRDLHALVWETFKSPLYVIWYVVTLALLGFHLRHGFWSAFQSMGLNHPKYSPIIYSLGILIVLVMAIGFIGIPIWIFITGA